MQARGVELWLWREVGRDSDSETDVRAETGERQRSRDTMQRCGQTQIGQEIDTEAERQ